MYADSMSLEMLRNRARTWSSSMTSTGDAATSSPGSKHKHKHNLGRQRELLEAQINDRDHRIARLEHDLREARGSLVSSRRGLDEVRLRQLEHNQMQSIAEVRHKRQSRAARQRIKVFKRDMDDMDSLHGYAELIQEAAPPTTDSSYVLKLQKQIKKASDRMDQQKEEMEVIRKGNEDVMESLMVEVCEAVEDRCRVEVDMANQIKKLRREVGQSEEKLRVELEGLERKLLRAQKSLEKFEKGDGDVESQSNGDAADSADASENNDDKPKSNGHETISAEGKQEEGEDDDEGADAASTSEEIKVAKLKGLQEQLKALQVESVCAEEELHATLKAKRDEIVKLKAK
mmetsp:Transcript_2039/g.5877  ORF Transcript_2039/g.5877 Transcript_2039/m.5877 type:complete len:345 (-) Transcript_2039:927-1961(-)